MPQIMYPASHSLCRSARLLALVAILTLASCSTVREPENQPINSIDESADFRRFGQASNAEVGENLVLLAFSGGGTRASALSYGVLQELRDTLIVNGDTQVRLLDEVDTISSVSGGSSISKCGVRAKTSDLRKA